MRSQVLQCSRRWAVVFALVLAVTCHLSVDAWAPMNGIVPTRKSRTCQESSRMHVPSLHPRMNPWRLAAGAIDTEDLANASPLDGLAISANLTSTSLAAEEASEMELTQKVINAVFLAASFGYALYTILNIDHGMTRGWTAAEIATRIPLDNWGNYEESLANKPIFTKTLINVIIYLLGDWLSQTAFSGKNVLDFEISRTLKNGFIGLCFGPLVHQYYQFSDTILPPEDGMIIRLQKILMDQTIYLTVKCSVYISAVGFLGGDDWPTVKKNVEDKIGGVVITAWKFWPLVHCITYGLIPARHRILWVNSVDLIWNAILATQAQKDSPPESADSDGIDKEEASMDTLPVSTEQELSSVLRKEKHSSETVSEEDVPALLVLDNAKVKESVMEMIPSSASTDNPPNQNMTSSVASIAV